MTCLFTLFHITCDWLVIVPSMPAHAMIGWMTVRMLIARQQTLTNQKKLEHLSPNLTTV